MSQALFAAIARANLDEVANLLAKGADPNELSTEWPFWSPLEEAIHTVGEGGPVEVLALLLRAGARSEAWTEASGREHPLMVMVMSGKSEGVRMLLANGSDPNIRGSDGLSPLGWCAQNGDVETAAVLLHYGARLTMNQAGGPRGMTPLGQAAWLLDLPMMELLLDAGADPQARDNDRLTASDRLPARDGT
jgi:ankyrin repeat protein